MAVLMRWLLIGLLISVGALLYVAVAATRHVWRQRRAEAGRTTDKGSGQDVLEPAGPNEAVEDGRAHNGETQKDRAAEDGDAAGPNSN
jgi:hypothetical protein